MSEEEQLSYSEAILKASPSITCFPLIPIRGVPLTNLIANNWDDIWAFRPDPSDLLITTYPKAGIVGDWRNHFTPEQTKTFDEDYKKQMKDVNIPFRTNI